MLEHQIHQACKSAYKQIFIMYKLCPLITQDAAQTLVQALVTSKLDYGNTLYFGISKSLLYKLQLVQNSAAHLVCGVRKYDHITQVSTKRFGCSFAFDARLFGMLFLMRFVHPLPKAPHQGIPTLVLITAWHFLCCLALFSVPGY